MIIQYRAAGGVPTYVTLANVANGDVVEDFSPDVSVTVQETPLAAMPLQVNGSYRQPIGNQVCKLTLKLICTYQNEATASAAARNNTLAFLGTKNVLQVTKSSDVEWYGNAVCSRCQARNLGSTIEYNLVFTTDMVTNTQPA